MQPEAFTLRISDTAINDLRGGCSARACRIRRRESPWEYGTSVDYLHGLIEYWRNGFDWRAQEARLNAFPQYKVPLHDIDVHFLHVPGKGPNPFPLLLMHGWPGSVFEFMRADPAADRSRELRRRSGRCVHRGCAIVAGLRTVVPPGSEALRHRGDR